MKISFAILSAMLLTILVSVPSFAQELLISGEAKSGILWERVEDRLGNSDSLKETVRLGSLDDAGPGDGRFRLNLDYTAASGNVGFRARLNWENFNNLPTAGPHWSYAFGWGNFFNDQLTLSVGKLGASPWGTGGPEMYRELEVSLFGGMRLEWKPNFVPGELNIGFVLNWINDVQDGGLDRDPNFIDLLSESVVGASYKNDWFLARAAYRFDSEIDDGTGRSGLDIKKEGTDLVYRLEEYALRRVLPNLSLWALGEFKGIGSEAPEITFMTRNWFFAQYAPAQYTALLRLGIDATYSRLILHARPSFSYNFFGGLLVPTLRFDFANDLGDAKIWPDSAYSYVAFDPQIQVNFAPGAYVALSYYYRLENKFGPPGPPEQQTQRINLRAGITF